MGGTVDDGVPRGLFARPLQGEGRPSLACDARSPVRLHHRAGQDALDKVGLCLAVRVHITRVPAGQFVLQGGIATGVVGVGHKPIAERQVPGKLVVVRPAAQASA